MTHSQVCIHSATNRSNVHNKQTSAAKLKLYHSTELNKESSPLLRLTTELRLHIYSYIETCPDNNWDFPETNYVYDAKRGTCMATRPKAQQLQRSFEEKRAEHYLLVLGVCRQMYDETELIAFTLGGFYFNSSRIFRVTQRMTRKQRCAMTRLTVELNIAQNGVLCLGHGPLFGYPFRSAMKELAGLKKVSFEINYTDGVHRRTKKLRAKLQVYIETAEEKLCGWIRDDIEEHVKVIVKAIGELHNVIERLQCNDIHLEETLWEQTT
jgi:hypothetical protein